MPAAADGPRWAMSVNLVLMQADALDEVDLDLVAGRQPPRNSAAPSSPQCCATARIGGMLSPGCE